MHHPNYSLWYLGSLGKLVISFKRILVAGVTVPCYLLLSLMMRWVKWTFVYEGCWIFQSYKPLSSYLNFSLILYWFFFLVSLPLFSQEVCLLFTCTFSGSINLNIFYKKKRSYNVIVIKWDRDYTSDEPRHWVRGPNIGLNKNSLSLYTDFEMSLFTQ